ncbi:GntR family transcriptional regulator [Acinetobacter sp. ANC 4558]|uniref:MocR-like pyridoxine biosynthesis transcription factor PdxR n=1 Tax=Acinetobacter sp. ANC 4558 TaxID=1977876 RepID=UPI000A339956|nr:PLP-dependent aminotransferase family protein [Acinetobacter sp. ANC 4558]OTG88283.1 GntR family transcriptional regulator [Acinetobacter sp. ANC 4558]
MDSKFKITLDKTLKTPLAEQIRLSIEHAIISGVLQENDRLPSWVDLASQLGVSRGTVKAAYEKLADGQFVIASRALGTRVSRSVISSIKHQESYPSSSFMQTYLEMTTRHGIFQSGIPDKHSFPAKVFAKIRAKSIRMESSGWPSYPDPRGEYELRREIAAYLALSRGIQCSPDQVFITSGFSGGLALSLLALNLHGKKAWIEDPCFPFSKHALNVAKIQTFPIPVDSEGFNIDFALQYHPDAAMALITPGQQAPLGMSLSLNRRLKLMEWAKQQHMWVIEDDYLGELQLDGRATPALFSLDHSGNVIHLGSFSKTLSPKLRIGFAVVPEHVIHQFEDITATLTPAPTPSLQHAIQEFMHEGHFLRHIRRTKRIYTTQRNELIQHLKPYRLGTQTAGLSILLQLPAHISDQKIAQDALAFGLAPAPLSTRYHQQDNAPSALILGIATAPIHHVSNACERLFNIIQHNMTT